MLDAFETKLQELKDCAVELKSVPGCEDENRTVRTSLMMLEQALRRMLVKAQRKGAGFVPSRDVRLQQLPVGDR